VLWLLRTISDGRNERWSSRQVVPGPLFQLKEVSQVAGVHVTHRKVQLDPRLNNIMPWMASIGAAAAAADYNNDGFY